MKTVETSMSRVNDSSVECDVKQKAEKRQEVSLSTSQKLKVVLVDENVAKLFLGCLYTNFC